MSALPGTEVVDRPTSSNTSSASALKIAVPKFKGRGLVPGEFSDWWMNARRNLKAVGITTEAERLSKYPALFEGHALHFYTIYEDLCEEEGTPLTKEGLFQYMQKWFDRASLLKASKLLVALEEQSNREDYLAFHKKFHKAGTSVAPPCHADNI